MNISTRQDQLQNQVITDITLETKSANDKKKPAYEYTPDSIWSNIKYLLGMMAVIIIPPFIPGVTHRGLIITYIGVVLGIYLMAFFIKLVMVLRTEDGRRKRTH